MKPIQTLKAIFVAGLLALTLPIQSYAADKPPQKAESEATSTIQTQLLEKTNEVFDWVKVGAEKTGSFVVEQTPLLIKEIIAYNIYIHIAYLVLGLSLMGGLTFTCFKFQLFKLMFITWVKKDDGWTVVGVLLIAALVIPTYFILTHNIEPIIKATFAPRLYILEYVKTMVK